MSGAAKTLCPQCGIPTKYTEGPCGKCRKPERHRCLMCSAVTGNTDRVCSNCAAYIRDAERHVDQESHALVGGRWAVDRGGIQRWQVAS